MGLEVTNSEKDELASDVKGKGVALLGTRANDEEMLHIAALESY